MMMPYSLSRVRDGAGDSGQMCNLLWEEDGELKVEPNGKPRVGVAVQVGSHYARTMENQDWWQTSYITEIIEEKDDYVKFKTGNSVYEWKAF
jgi:hypothetical protein